MSIPIDSVLSGNSDREVTVDQKNQPGDSVSQPVPDHGVSQEADWQNKLPASFCEEHAPGAKRFAMSIVRRWADAEEIVQEAFCRLWEKRQDGTELHPASLFSVVRNLAIDKLRHYGRRKFETVDAERLAGQRPESNEQHLERLESGIEASLAAMSDQWADALRLKINGELSYEEIARVLDATTGQVRTWIYRARKQLAEDLQRSELVEGWNLK